MDELLVRRMPHNLEAEQSVLGSILIDARCLPDVIGIVRSDDFYLEQNRDIFATLLSMFNKARVIDAVTLLDELRTQGTRDIDTLRTYVMRLLDITPTAAHVLDYARIVKDFSLLRAVASAAADIASMVGEAAGEAQGILDAAEQKIYDIRNDTQRAGMASVNEVFNEVYERINLLAQSPNGMPGISSGIPGLDNHLHGLQPGNLIIFASNAGMGKTSVTLNIAVNAAKRSNRPVAFFSLEMSNEQLGLRLLSSEARIENNLLATGRLKTEDWDALAAGTSRLSKLQLFFDDNPALNVLEMKAKCRRIHNLGLVIIDYLQLVQPNPGKRSDNRVNEVGDISRTLKIMAKELNVPVICCAQLSRRNTQREDKRPILSDLRESGSIEQDADSVIFLHRESYHDRDGETDPEKAELIIAKNRHGETGIVEMKWNGQFTSFTSIDHVHS